MGKTGRILRLMTALLSLLLLLACAGAGPEGASEEVPTLIPLAQLPDPTATSLLPPTRAISTPISPADQPTPEVTRKPTPTPPPVDPSINIIDPDPNDDIPLGSVLDVRGLLDAEPDQTIGVELWSANGRLLASAPAALNEAGWFTELTIPINVAGSATVRVDLAEPDGTIVAEHSVPVWLEPPLDWNDRFITVSEPAIADTVVSGFSLFFRGEVFLPVNNTMSVSIWTEGCQERVAVQSYVLGRSSAPFDWQGFVVAPKDMSGPACAIVSTGTAGDDEDEWREVVIPIEILATDAPGATGVTIAAPAPESTVFAGTEVVFYGTAQNVSVDTVTVSVLMENGRVAGQSQTSTDYWGYWETTVNLPFDVAGTAEITVAAGSGDAYGQTTSRVTVLPPPTPPSP
jgi:hypothetical protein